MEIRGKLEPSLSGILPPNGIATVLVLSFIVYLKRNLRVMVEILGERLGSEEEHRGNQLGEPRTELRHPKAYFPFSEQYMAVCRALGKSLHTPPFLVSYSVR